MVRFGSGFIGVFLPCAALAQPSSIPPSQALHANYETYAAGIHIAEVDSSFTFGPHNYQMNLGYHTTGVVSLFAHGHQFDRASGTWHGHHAAPSEFVGKGEWRGVQRLADIGYQDGKPTVRHLIPPNTDEREPVPDALQANSIDTLSALAELIHVVTETGRCETSVHTYDGRRVVDIEAHTAGEELLAADSRSSFAGKTLRCDFKGRLTSGFKFDDDRERDSKPMHGTAWLATVVPGGPPLPVRMAFETRWFGDATMYLTGIGPGDRLQIAGGN